MENREYAAFQRARPYFELVRRALGGLVDGGHFFRYRRRQRCL